MSMRDVHLKSSSLGYSKTAVISEVKGNPSRIEIYDSEGESLISLDITATNALSSGRIRKKKLHLRWELDDQSVSKIKDKIISILEIPEDPTDLISGSKYLKRELKEHSNSNLILVKGEDNKAVVEFIDQDGQLTGPRIYIHKCLLGEV